MFMIMVIVRFCESGDDFQWTVATQVPSVLLFRLSLLIIWMFLYSMNIVIIIIIIIIIWMFLCSVNIVVTIISTSSIGTCQALPA